MLRLARLTLALALVLGCTSTIGRRFDPDLAQQLVPGRSTTAEAEALLGTPSARSVDGDGNVLLQWQYARGTALGAAQGAHLAILFDGEGRMLRIVHDARQGSR